METTIFEANLFLHPLPALLFSSSRCERPRSAGQLADGNFNGDDFYRV